MANSTRVSKNIWRVIDLLNWGEQYFTENGFDSPRKEIEILLEYVIDCSRIELYLRFEETLTKSELAKLRNWVQRRKKHEPIQYITGKANFYNIEINVTPDVLIPRPESERLIETLIDTTGENPTISILDIGSGSGCLALAIANELPSVNVLGIDISENVIKLARQNANALKLTNVKFKQVDFLTENIDQKFDIIISNPPYIGKDEMQTLMPEVKNYEPHSALTDFADGLSFYHRIAKECAIFLNQNGWLFLEVGLNEHPPKVLKIFNSDKYKNVELIKDYNGDDRVLKAQLA